MLIKRIISAIIGIAWLFYAVQKGGWYYMSTISLMVVVAWYEYWNMLRKQGVEIFWFSGIVASLVLLFCAWLGNEQEIMFLFVLFSLMLLIRLIFAAKKFNVEDAFFSLAGLFYIGFLFMHLILLRFLESEAIVKCAWGDMPIGNVCLWLVFFAVWSTDTFAFFVGSAFGRNKLCANVSPGKTWEGAIGGTLGSMLVMYTATFFVTLPLYKLLALGAVASVSGQFGDLLESALKRFCEVKDSGSIMPGHGGILDRMDSMLFAVPLSYYYVLFFLLR